MAAWHERNESAGAQVEQLSAEGYQDGLQGRPARYLDADYQAAWRRGRERRELQAAGGVPCR